MYTKYLDYSKTWEEQRDAGWKSGRHTNWLWTAAILDTKRGAGVTISTSVKANSGRKACNTAHLWPLASFKQWQQSEEQQAVVGFCSPLKYNKSTATPTSGKGKQKGQHKHTNPANETHHDFLAPLHRCHLELWVIGFSHSRPASFCNILGTPVLRKMQQHLQQQLVDC